MNKLIYPITVSIIAILHNFSFSQSPIDSLSIIQQKVEPKLFVITQKNGEKIIGEILSDDGRELLLLAEKIGKIYIPKPQIIDISEYKKTTVVENNKPREVIKNRKEESKLKDFDIDSTNSIFSNKYFFNANALPVNKKENYSTIYLLGFDLHFAVSKRFSMGVSSTFIGSPIGITGKYAINNGKKIHLACQIGVASSTYLISGKGYAGMGKIIGTFGSNNNNVSISAGYDFIGNISSEIFKDISYVPTEMTFIPAMSFSLGGIKKIGKGTSFIFDSKVIENRTNRTLTSISGYTAEGDIIYKTENELNSTLLLFPGLRFQKFESKAVQFNLGCYLNYYKNTVKFIPIPMVSWYRRF